MDDLANPKEPLVQALRTVVHMAVRVLAVAAVIIAMSVGYWLRKGGRPPPPPRP